MKKQFVCSINRNPNTPGWYVFVIGYYDSLNLPRSHFGGINEGFAFVLEFWFPISVLFFGRDIKAIETKDNLEKDISEQADLLGKQIKEQEEKRAILRSKRKK